MNLQSIYNKISPWAHMELEFDVLNVDRKPVKCAIHFSKRKKLKEYIYVFIRCLKTKQLDFFLKEF
jgi:hypothetical protein